LPGALRGRRIVAFHLDRHVLLKFGVALDHNGVAGPYAAGEKFNAVLILQAHLHLVLDRLGAFHREEDPLAFLLQHRQARHNQCRLAAHHDSRLYESLQRQRRVGGKGDVSVHQPADGVDALRDHLQVAFDLRALAVMDRLDLHRLARFQ